MLIATWFVSDTDEERTFFPQLQAWSSTPKTKQIYWRCIAAFYATSRLHNPQNPHAFFTNAKIPEVDGVNIKDLLQRLDVEVIVLPISFRLPAGRVASWGNQFYIFDIISHLASTHRWPSALVLDSDVVWIRSALEIEAAIDRHGVLTYECEYSPEELINGVSRVDLTRFSHRHGGAGSDVVTYCGGEIFAAKQQAIENMASDVTPLWAATVAGDEDAPQEEAHLLSVLYHLLGTSLATANPFLKRMWTSFKFNNTDPSDLSLTLWHLPWEKRRGFKRLFKQMKRDGLAAVTDARTLNIEPESLARIFGIPERGKVKFVRDIYSKAVEKVEGSSIRKSTSGRDG